jgi:hypothetical protein
MAEKIVNWLAMRDQKFLTMMKDEGQRRKLLNQLYTARMACVLSLVFPGVLFVLQLGALIFGGSDSVMLLILVMFIGIMLFYSQTDSAIRTIKLYELLLTRD